MSINQKFPNDPELPKVNALLKPIVKASYNQDYKQAVQLTKLASEEQLISQADQMVMSPAGDMKKKVLKLAVADSLW